LNPLALQPAALGRGLRTAGDKLRDLIVPDALAALVTHPLIGVGIGAPGKPKEKGGEAVEKVRKELEELLASKCPMCESVVAGLDRPFVAEEEDDGSWAV
jgi:vacuolar protein sorting-associated protein 18